VVGVEQWAEIRRLHFVGKLSQREIHRRTGLHRDTIRRALASELPPKYSRPAKGSKLDPFKHEIGRLLDGDPDLPGVRVGELLEPLGFDGGKTILDDYLREIRPFFQTVRTTQRTVYVHQVLDRRRRGRRSGSSRRAAAEQRARRTE